MTIGELRTKYAAFLKAALLKHGVKADAFTAVAKTFLVNETPEEWVKAADLATEYFTLRRNAASEVGSAEWEAEFKKRLAKVKKPTPEQRIEEARKTTVKCPRCRGTGIYNWGGTINGVPVHSGPCFRCLNKGRQNQEDFRRNWGHDQHIRVV